MVMSGSSAKPAVSVNSPSKQPRGLYDRIGFSTGVRPWGSTLIALEKHVSLLALATIIIARPHFPSPTETGNDPHRLEQVRKPLSLFANLISVF